MNPNRSGYIYIGVGALIALGAEFEQLRSGSNSRDWLLGVIFATGCAVALLPFVRAQGEVGRMEPLAVMSAVGIGIVLAVAGSVGALPTNSNSDSDSESTVSGTPNGSAITAGPGNVVVTLTAPKDGTDVEGCAQLSGSAELPPGKTLVLANQNLDNHDPTLYYQPVVNWRTPERLKKWIGVQYFGRGDDSVGQTYQVQVLAVDVDTVSQILAKGEWASTSLPEGAEIVASVTLNRVPGAGPPVCS